MFDNNESECEPTGQFLTTPKVKINPQGYIFKPECVNEPRRFCQSIQEVEMNTQDYV